MISVEQLDTAIETMPGHVKALLGAMSGLIATKSAAVAAPTIEQLIKEIDEATRDRRS